MPTIGTNLWTLTYDPTGANVEQALADWGITGMRIEYVSQAMDTVAFRLAGSNVDDPLVFAFLKECVIKSGRTSTDGVVFSGGRSRFRGLVLEPKRAAQGGDESMTYKLGGPWWYFENLTAEVDFKIITAIAPGGAITYATFRSTHFLLNWNAQNLRQTTGQIIEEMVKLSITTGAPMQILPDETRTVINLPGENDGTALCSAGIRSDLYVPLDEVNTISVAECIRKMFRWTPDLVSWFDYTTDPYPTFRCCRHTDMAQVNIDLLDGGDVAGVSITSATLTPRYDLQRPFVKFIFETTNELNGQSTFLLSYQTYPPSPDTTGIGAFRGLEMTVALQGANVHTTDATLTSQVLPVFGVSSSADLAYIKGKCNWFADKTVAALTVNSVSFQQADPNAAPVAFSPTYNYEIVQGGITPWMSQGGVPALWDSQIAIFNVDYTLSNGEFTKGHSIQVEIRTTNLNTNGIRKKFTEVSGTPFSEAVPSNLAQEFYNAVNVLQWDGELKCKQDEADWLDLDGAPVGIGCALNIDDSAQFAGMAATIQQVRVDVDTGKTTVKIGPNRMLTVNDIVDLMRVVRRRLVLLPLSTMTGGTLGGGTSLALADAYPAGKGAAGAGYKPVAVASDNGGATNNYVAMNTNPLASGPGAGSWGLLVQQAGDNLINVSYPDAIINGVKRPVALRLYDVCTYDPATGAPTVQQCVLLGSVPFPKT